MILAGPAGTYSSGGNAVLLPGSFVTYSSGGSVLGPLLNATTVKVALSPAPSGPLSVAGKLRTPGTAINAVNSRGSFAVSPLGTITAASWASTSGGQATFTLSTDLTGQIVTGQVIGITGVISTGGTTAGVVSISLDDPGVSPLPAAFLARHLRAGRQRHRRTRQDPRIYDNGVNPQQRNQF
ncbi:MAG: hypothetical protein WDN06_09990 [Asticcacaulis sp.]